MVISHIHVVLVSGCVFVFNQNRLLINANLLMKLRLKKKKKCIDTNTVEIDTIN